MFIAWAVLLMSPLAYGHKGTESETTVRLAKGSVSITVRCAPDLIWRIVGKVPAGSSEQAFAAIQPELEKLGPTLISLSKGGKAVAPPSVKTALEPENHVAIVFNFAVPADGEFSLSAPFLAKADPLDASTVSFFDYRVFPHPAEPFSTIELQRAVQSITFSFDQATLQNP